MNARPRLADGLERLEAVFRGTAGAELHDTDVAELAGLEEEECRRLLRVLRETGAIDEPRNRVYVGQQVERLLPPGLPETSGCE
jgi:transcription initiation factor IIE alpha subunit